MPVFPGVCTPTEIMQVLEFDLDIVKFFPAAQYGGLAAIKALAAPFPSLKFMPTGGVTETNLRDYLAFPKVIACGGSWMVKETLIQSGNFTTITDLSAKAVSLAKSAT